MFEEEADKSFKEVGFVNGLPNGINKYSYEAGFQKGAEFGYNKVNEWHYVKDGDLPIKSGRYWVCNLFKIKRKNFIGTNSAEFDSKNGIFVGIDNSTIYAWKEIVLPELKESEKSK